MWTNRPPIQQRAGGNGSSSTPPASYTSIGAYRGDASIASTAGSHSLASSRCASAQSSPTLQPATGELFSGMHTLALPSSSSSVASASDAASSHAATAVSASPSSLHLVDLVRRLSHGENSVATAADAMNDEMEDMTPVRALHFGTPPSSPPMTGAAANDIVLQHFPSTESGHRKAASCPLQLADFPLSSLPSERAGSPTITASPSQSERVLSSPTMKAPSSPSKLNHTYHPYARGSMTREDRERERDGLPPLSAAQSSPAHAVSHHRPTVISPASRFLSRKVGSATLPATLMKQHANAYAAAYALNLPHSASASPPPSHAAAAASPPLLELSVSDYAHPSTPNAFTASLQAAAAMHGSHSHSHSHPASPANSYATLGVSASPPRSPVPSLSSSLGSHHGNNSGRPPLSHSVSMPFRMSTPPTASPLSRPYGGSGHSRAGSLQAHGDTDARAHSPQPFAASPSLQHNFGASTMSLTAIAPSLSLHRGSSGGLVFPASFTHSPMGSQPHSPIIRPDFSAFESGVGGLSNWHKLSAHSPAKHRSLPGTPLHGARNVYSMPATPNARLTKSRRSSQDRSIMETAAMLLDYTQLHTPITSLPLMSSLPVNPSFQEMCIEQNELAHGSFGDVFEVKLSSATPFATQFQPPQPSFLHQSSPPASLPPSPFLLSTSFAAPSPSTTTATSMHDVVPSSGSSVSSIKSGGSPPAPATTLYQFGYKRTRVQFASIHERTRMLRKYVHLYELIQKLRTTYTQHNQAMPPPPSPSSAGEFDEQLLGYIDSQTFFPRHAVYQSHVWQENNKLHVLMQLCTRGDLTTYWSIPTAQELAEMKRAMLGLDSASSMISEAESELVGADEETLLDSASPAGGAFDLSVQRPPVSPLCEATVWRLLLEIASALALMHSAGYLHLDVKPQNIYVTEDETFKLGDYDSGVMLHSYAPRNVPSPTPLQHHSPSQLHHPSIFASIDEAASSSGGSSHLQVHHQQPRPVSAASFSAELDGLEEGDGNWCAPELLQSMQHAAPACDVYSLGASVYGVLNDEVPFSDDLYARGQRAFAFRNLKCAISHDLHDTILAMVSNTPTARPSAFEVMQRARSRLAQPVHDAERNLHWPK